MTEYELASQTQRKIERDLRQLGFDLNDPPTDLPHRIQLLNYPRMVATVVDLLTHTITQPGE